jgi:hypothetical protein
LGITRDEESAPFNEIGEAILAVSDILPTSDEVTGWLASLSSAGVSEDRRALSARLHPTFDRSPVAIWYEARRRGRVRSG